MDQDRSHPIDRERTEEQGPKSIVKELDEKTEGDDDGSKTSEAGVKGRFQG